mmetsp:Transcript_26572/g.67006  ORF Transcript_26572/g.67006 Transcript_26572/m.67006 type:complete len:89 (-) Transcript_26572:320-586(-)|eukprot:CAMPEP_0173441076 /NCGR_PEP_ID=MMETSP1357-20121228/23763_1 /TAXON_ID=77926 /ORGANISM="Hemiselmis rufescens, Strain PCC563" /LENGTH=88 /DNA_ID=CAMNT_0014406627 /DNA_START=126 /DNA_END=392 /DNA_ORIENTATION=-
MFSYIAQAAAPAAYSYAQPAVYAAAAAPQQVVYEAPPSPLVVQQPPTQYVVAAPNAYKPHYVTRFFTSPSWCVGMPGCYHAAYNVKQG